MEVLNFLAEGFAVALTPTNLTVALIAVLIGTLIGMLPGIGPINGIVVLIPLAFAIKLPPESMLILFAGVYYGAEYGNAISASLLNVPGTSAAVITALEGHTMSRMGRAGKALATSAVSSFFGGTISIIAMMFFAPLLSQWAIKFGPAEYFALIVFAFSTLSSLTGTNLAKGILATTLGLMLSTIGFDPLSSVDRFTFGELKLLDGLDFVVVVIGFFAINEVLRLAYKTEAADFITTELGRVIITFKEFMSAFGSLVRGSVLGFFIGILPGAGAAMASFISYMIERRLWNPKGETFAEHEDIRGLASPEAANNAAVGGALIPLLTLGIPGSGTTAVMLGALLGLGITPGPLFIKQYPEVFWGLIASMYVGNALLLVLNLPLVGIWVRILRVPDWFLYPAVVAISFVAVYAVSNSPFDITLMAMLGILGFFLHMFKLPMPPVILGLILGPLMERNLRRALSLSDGDWSYLVQSPISITLWIMAILSLCLPLFLGRKRQEELIDAADL
ncbi:MAG: tripartite tricarboxylate transporter permease [Chloroflexota bacterium]